MGKWIQRGVLAVLLVVFAIIIKDFIGPFIPHKPVGDERLKDGEKEKIIIDDRGNVSRTRRKNGTQETRRDSGSRKTEVILNDDGTFRVVQKTHGFIFEPGIGAGFDGKPLFCLDAQIYFARNLGVITGVAVPMEELRSDQIRMYVAGNYRLPFKAFQNTSVYAGYNTKKEVQVGARVRF